MGVLLDTNNNLKMIGNWKNNNLNGRGITYQRGQPDKFGIFENGAFK